MKCFCLFPDSTPLKSTESYKETEVDPGYVNEAEAVEAVTEAEGERPEKPTTEIVDSYTFLDYKNDSYYTNATEQTSTYSNYL